MNTSEQEKPVQNPKKGTARGQQNSLSTSETIRRLPKSHQDYWHARLRKRKYLDRQSEKYVEIPDWQVRLKQGRRDAWFNLGTPNQAAAARKAREIYTFLEANGWDATIARFKRDSTPQQDITLQQFSELYRQALQRLEYPPRPHTAARYFSSLEFICRQLRLSRITALTPDRVKGFIGDYLAHGRKEGRAPESVKVSCNAMLRNAAAVFSRPMLEQFGSMGLSLANPFAGQKLRRIKLAGYSPMNRDMLNLIWREAVKLRDGDPEAPEPARHESKGRNGKRIRWQDPDFRVPQPAAYTLLLLELGLGLRRHEADKAQWDWFYTDANGRHYLEVKATPYFTPKGKESRIIPVEKPLYDAIQATRSQVSPFIVPGRLPKRYAPGREPKNIVYRCDPHHRALAAWLRQRGIQDGKPCHTLRKEFGSYVATAFGLFHAQRMLGHSSPQVTEAFYAGLTQLPELSHAKLGKVNA